MKKQTRFYLPTILILGLVLAAIVAGGCVPMQPQGGGSLAGAAAQAVTVQFSNQTNGTVEVYLFDADGNGTWQFDLEPGQSRNQQAQVGQLWSIYPLGSDTSLRDVTIAANTTAVTVGTGTGAAQPTAPAPTPVPTAVAATGGSGLTPAEEQAVLQAHNTERQNYPGVGALQWSPQLAQYAREWAQQMANTGNFAHRSNARNNPFRPNEDLGENLAAGTAGAFTMTQHTQGWINEKQDYDYNTNSCTPGRQCGHFTQVIWKATQFVGCGKATGGGQDYLVCNYYPAGNFTGQKPY